MSPRQQASRTAIDLIKAFEGYRARAARLADGRWTIGHGHTQTAREGAYVSPGDAEALLIYDLIAVAQDVRDWTFTPLTQNQFDALCAFGFNVGPDAFRLSSVLSFVNQGRLLQAAEGFDVWRRAEFEGQQIVVDGLVRRRAAEKALFLTPTDGWVPTPTQVVRPTADIAENPLIESPTVLNVEMTGSEAVARRPSSGSATERAVAAVTSRLQTIVAEPPIVMSSEPRVLNQDPMSLTRKDLAAPAIDLPPPTWPVRLDGVSNAFVLTAPTEVAAEPAFPPAQNLPQLDAGRAHEPTLFDPRVLSFGRNLSETTTQALAAVDFDFPANDSDPTAGDRIVESKPADTAPLAGLALLGIAFFGGGLYWSASATAGSGPFNPWIVGWLACMGGVIFFATAAYLFLSRLGHFEPDGHDDGRSRKEFN